MSQAPIVHQQSLLPLTASHSSQTLHINTAGSKSTSIFGAGRKRGFEEISGLDDEAYTRKHIASQGSIFFRRPARSPRCFLWRVLDAGKLLEIQSVDLFRDAHATTTNESGLIFRLEFKDTISKNGVVFADSESSDALECFVLTTGRELFTITLKRDLLTRKHAPTDFDPTTCIKLYTPSALTHRHLYRFVSVSSLELLISLHDGGFLRLTRSIGEHGAQWRESLFSEQSWANTLRGMISLKRQQTVRYGDTDLLPSALAALAPSPDGKHIWTVSLEHELATWDAQTGKVIAVRDLSGNALNQEIPKQQKSTMGAEQAGLLQVIRSVDAPKSSKALSKHGDLFQYYIVLRSPKDHELKIFGVHTDSQLGGETPQLEDICPGFKLVPPIDKLMRTSIWHLEELFVRPGAGWRATSIWIRARSGTLCRTFSITIDLLDRRGRPVDLQYAWTSSWTTVDVGQYSIENLKDCTDFPGDLEHVAFSIPSISEKWLDFLFFPGRFSQAGLETAIHIYRKAHSLPAASAKGFNLLEIPLKQRLIQAVESTVGLKRSNGQPNYEKYANDLQAQWQSFYALLAHLHSKRLDSIALAFDEYNSMAWSVCADLAGPIRDVSALERLALNDDLFVDDSSSSAEDSLLHSIFGNEEDVRTAQLLSAARAFRSELSPEFRDKFARAVLIEARTFEGDDRNDHGKRVETLYEAYNFAAEVTDDEFQALTDAAEGFGGLGNLNAAAFLALLDALDELDQRREGSDSAKELCQFGDRMTVEIVQSTMERRKAIVLDILNLIVFMVGDLDQADLHDDFMHGVGEIYESAMLRLRQIELLTWLCSRIVPEIAESEKTQDSTDSLAIKLQSRPEAGEGILLILRLFIAGWKAASTGSQTLPELLTKWSKGWIHELQLPTRMNQLVQFIFAWLLKREFYSLTDEFTEFFTIKDVEEPWLAYLEGRHSLATGDLARSSVKFRSAASRMAKQSGIAGLDIANFLSADQRAYFGSGISRYYQHIAALYEAQRLFSYVADFASLALEHSGETVALSSSLADIDKRKANKDSPVAARIEDTMEEIRILKLRERTEDIRNRLFTALIQTGRFKEAWDCVILIGETRRSNLGVWIKAVIEAEVADVLLDVTAQTHDDVLMQEIDTILLGLAKKSISSGSGVPYHQILYAFRTQRADFRGAAEILHEYLDRLRSQSTYQQDPEDETLLHAFVLLINTLACCGEDDAWILAEPADPTVGKRRLVTLADIRREYTTELDRRSDVLMGRYPLVGEDDMEIL